MEAVHAAQEQTHGDAHDYAAGSPHIKHPDLRDRIVEQLHAVVNDIARQRPGRPVEVLEVGAGHGAFTAPLLTAGTRVTVTEMSSSSVARLQTEFGGRDDVRVIHDPHGRWAEQTEEMFDLVVCISVLHHMPDYLQAIRQLTELTREGGAFVSWQDPMRYDRQPRSHRLATRLSYYAWRTGQGNLRQGAATITRRARSGVDERFVEDMTEYHVVRNGVDEQAIGALLRERYEHVELTAYWSTQSRLLQRAGERLGLLSEFSVLARGRHA